MMHLVIDNETAVATHVFICQSDGQGKAKAKNLELKGELVRAEALGEELLISRSLFILSTPTAYDVFIVRSDDLNYRYSRSVALKKASEWLMHDRCAVGLESTFVTLDSEDLTMTIFVRSTARVFIESVDNYEEICIDPKDGDDFIKLRP